MINTITYDPFEALAVRWKPAHEAMARLAENEGWTLQRAWDEVDKRDGELRKRCPALWSRHYLGPLVEAWSASSQDHADGIVKSWEASARRQRQRVAVLARTSDGESENFLLHGGQTGTGKTSVAYELIWRWLLDESYWPLLAGDVDDADLPLAMTGFEFAGKISASGYKLDEVISEFASAKILLLDDVDKKGDAKQSKFSASVQQAFYDLVERRTQAEDKITILTMNSGGAEFADKFDDDIRPYVVRRLKERFRAINFDPK